MWPVLHGQIGIGNNIINHMFDIIDRDIEKISSQELALRESIPWLELLLDEARLSPDVWRDSKDRGKLLAQKLNTRKRLERDIEQIESGPVNITNALDLTAMLDAVNTDISDLMKIRTRHSQAVEKRTKGIRDAKAELDKYRKDRKKTDVSLYNITDKILQKHGVDRQSFHGEDFPGVKIMKFMEDAAEIMDEICKALIENKSDDCNLSNIEIEQFCFNIKLALTLGDGGFSAINQEDPTDAHCDQTQEKIDLASAFPMKLDISVTPKWHGLMKHVVNQLRKIPGGLVHLNEQWVELQHQSGSRCDESWRVVTHKMQALIRSRRQSWERNPKVQKEVQAVDAEFCGKRRSTGKRDKTEKRRKKKEENRAKAFDVVKAAIRGGNGRGGY